MPENKIKKIIADVFLDIAEGIESGKFEKKYTIGIVINDNEHGKENVLEAIDLCKKKNINTILIEGQDSHKEMEKMLMSGNIDGAVTMHYSFPIGISTVGKVITPAKGKVMYLATTTGTSDTDRVCAMIKNAIYGIITAKADGIESPTLGIANIDGARQCEKALLKLNNNGYHINFAYSSRADGGNIMRGNDFIQGTPDVMVMDSLTGNLMVKILSSYTTGGGYESLGWGYGPGIGENFNNLIMIVSRASGTPLITGAVEYAVNLLKNDINKIASQEISNAKKAGLDNILKEFNQQEYKVEKTSRINTPPKEIVVEQISGVEVMDLDDAVVTLWKEQIYAETGMGCTGPIIRVSEANKTRAIRILTDNQYI